MSDKIIPEDVEKFILEKIESVAHMEALLILRENPQQEWTADSLATRLYINESQTAEILARLSSDGFVAPSENEANSYRYQPASPELRHMIDRLADAYRKHLVPVANLIHSKPKPRVQEFADAFRLRKDT
jgi:transcription initiation factor IIE alpha subunit